MEQYCKSIYLLAPGAPGAITHDAFRNPAVVHQSSSPVNRFIHARSDHMMRSIIAATGCALLLAGCIGDGTSTREPQPLRGDSTEPLQTESTAAVGATFPYVE